MVGGDVLNSVGCCGARVDLHWAHISAVDVCGDPEVEGRLRAGDRGAEVVVRVPYLDDGGVEVGFRADDGFLASSRLGCMICAQMAERLAL